ncbi:MAG: hypothetical protein HY897_09530 [Deltaproteobacteria bacterium]|nr:hypothetical protein [Deltaproteobacteria bacterium]
MRPWFPAKGERWVFQVEVESVRPAADRIFVRYRPVYMQQRGAIRELEEKDFLGVFYPEVGPKKRPLTSSGWLLTVEIRDFARTAMTVIYRHVTPSGAPISDARRMSVHVFRATFRREMNGADAMIEKGPEWEKERRLWWDSQRAPSRGEWYLLGVTIESVREADGKRFVKYIPQDTQQNAAPRELEEKVFRGLFEPNDGAVEDIVPGDDWFMMVGVTDYDSEEFSVWYRAISSTGGTRGAIKHLSDYVFLATFKPAR